MFKNCITSRLCGDSQCPCRSLGLCATYPMIACTPVLSQAIHLCMLRTVRKQGDKWVYGHQFRSTVYTSGRVPRSQTSRLPSCAGCTSSSTCSVWWCAGDGCWTGSEEPYRKCTRHSWTDEHIPTFHLVFVLYIDCVSIVNNLTGLHGSCRVYLYRYPRQSTPGLIGMSLCALELNRVICLIFWLLIFILLYCSACVSIYAFHCHLYILLPFLIIFIHFIITVMSTPVITYYLNSLSVLFFASHWWRLLNSYQDVWIILKSWAKES